MKRRTMREERFEIDIADEVMREIEMTELRETIDGIRDGGETIEREGKIGERRKERDGRRNERKTIV